MKILIIDTSTEKSIVAFGNEIKLLLTLPISGIQSSRVLLPTIKEGLLALQMELKDIEAIAIGIGPGSFTGIRVGYAIAQGLAFARKLPLVGFCSLSGFISQKEGKFASVIDARIGGAYVLHQERIGNEIFELEQPKLVSKERLKEELASVQEIVSPALERLGIEGTETAPDASHLLHLSLQRLKKTLQPVEILYLREGITG